MDVQANIYKYDWRCTGRSRDRIKKENVTLHKDRIKVLPLKKKKKKKEGGGL